jgi:hypothetical protein
LEESRDDAERRVREGLDAVATRNDDLALRRVWSRLAEMVPGAGLTGGARIRWAFLLALGGLGVGIVAGAWLLRPLVLEVPRWPSALSIVTRGSLPVLPPAPVGAPADRTDPVPPAPTAPAPVAADRTPMLLGPATVTTGARERRVVRLKSGARVSLRPRTILEVDPVQRPVLRRGHARLDVPKQPVGEAFSVDAGPYVVVVLGTKFGLSVTSRTVKVEVREGLVQVWRGGHVIPLGAGASWQGPTRLTGPRIKRRSVVRALPAARRAGPDQHPLDSYQEAHAALARGDSAAAVSTLRRAAEGVGPAAENAGLELGKILRDQLYQHRQAIVVWTRYRARFPNGMLLHEADVNIIETLLMLGERAEARSEIELFLRRHPHSERSAEMAQVLARLNETSEANEDHPADTTTQQDGETGPSAARTR